MKISHILLLLLGAHTLRAAIIPMAGIQTSVPAGTNDPDGLSPYTDDVLLESVTFGTTTFANSGGQFSTVQSVYVPDDGSRTQVNAEWGDHDTGSDGNPDPFTRAGLNPADQESSDPTIQALGLASAFSTRSLVEGTDGEAGSFTFYVIFNAGITDNSSAIDDVPEIVIFERGNNDTTTIHGITGGTFDNPTLSTNSLVVNSGDLTNVGFSINTTEIATDQPLAAGGIDLNDFGEPFGTTFWGIAITSNGADFYGQFLSAEDPGNQFNPDVPDSLKNPDALIVIPEPGSLVLFIICASTAWVAGARKYRKRLMQTA